MNCDVCGCPEARWLRVRTVARTLSCDSKSIRRLIKKGELRGMRLGAEWRVEHASLDAYVRSNRVGFPEDCAAAP